MINDKNLNNLLNPFTLAKIIFAFPAIVVGVYSLAYSNVENMNSFPFRYTGTIQQTFLSLMFFTMGIDELKKINGKKSTAYFILGFAFIMTILNIITFYSRYKAI